MAENAEVISKEQLFRDHIKHKKAEANAKKKRIAVEEQIDALYKSKIPEGKKSKTFKEEEIGFKINVQKNIKFNLDQEKWGETRIHIPENLRPEKITYSLLEKGFDYLKKNEKEIYKKVSDCVEVKENKSTITVEKI